MSKGGFHGASERGGAHAPASAAHDRWHALPNCVVAVERCLRALPDVQRVRASYPPGRAVITHEGNVDLNALKEALKGDGYTVNDIVAADDDALAPRKSARDYARNRCCIPDPGRARICPSAISFAAARVRDQRQMSYGLVFLIGLVASVSSCLAVTGGLLVAFAAKYNEANPYLTDRAAAHPAALTSMPGGSSPTRCLAAPSAPWRCSYPHAGRQRCAHPHRLVSDDRARPQHAGALPALGQSSAVTAASRSRIASMMQRQPRPRARPFCSGAATFFLPCGFTQALQLYVLEQGELHVGALTMLAFAARNAARTSLALRRSRVLPREPSRNISCALRARPSSCSASSISSMGLCSPVAT